MGKKRAKDRTRVKRSVVWGLSGWRDDRLRHNATGVTRDGGWQGHNGGGQVKRSSPSDYE